MLHEHHIVVVEGFQFRPVWI